MLLATTVATGQSTSNDAYVPEDNYVIPFDSLSEKDKFHYSFTMGAGFGYSSNLGNYFSTYYKPMVSYDVSPKFKLLTGIQYRNSNVSKMPIYTDYGYQSFSGNISQYYAFVGGQYQLTDRLSVGGSVFYDFSAYNELDGTAVGANNNGLKNLGYSANFEYKVTDNMTLQGEIRVNDKSPFSNGFMGSAEHSFFGR
jgi:outer membrane receptor protein involved in Fe transport